MNTKLIVGIIIIAVIAVGIYYRMSNTTNTNTMLNLTAQLSYTNSAGNAESRPAQTFPIKAGETIHLKDAQAGAPMASYSLLVVSADENGVVLKQVADETGATNPNGFAAIGALSKGTTITVGPNVPGGGPKWELTLN